MNSIDTSSDETLTGAPRPVGIVAHGETTTEGEELTTEIYLPRDAILTVSAYTKGNFDINKLTEPRPETANAGVNLELSVDGQLVASDLCFEAQSETIDFFASASYSKFLKKGKHHLTAKRIEYAINGPTHLEMTYHAVVAKVLAH